MEAKRIPYAEIDPNILGLVKALNKFDGIQTIGSCGGHENPTPAQWEKGTWYVKMIVDWNQAGLFSLEFLAWLINDYYRASENAILYPIAAPPYLNEPGKMLTFALDGACDPKKLGKWIRKAHAEYFIPPEHEDQPAHAGQRRSRQR